MAVTIRKSIPNDVYGIREVQRITWLNTYPNDKYGITKDDVAEKFAIDNTPEGKHHLETNKLKYQDPTIFTYVAEDQDKIIGFCVAVNQPNQGRIAAIYVLPEFQGQGIGNTLFQTAIASLPTNKSIHITVAEYNQKAISFYTKHGFSIIGQPQDTDAVSRLPSGKVIPEIEMSRHEHS